MGVKSLFRRYGKRAKHGLFLASVLTELSLVACGGGGSSPAPLVRATPTPVVSATPAPVTQSVTPAITTSGTTATVTPSLSPATLAGLGLASDPTISGPSSLASVIPSGTQVTYSNAEPSSISTFSFKHSRSTKSLTVPGATALGYTVFTVPIAFTVPAGTSLRFSYVFAATPSSSLSYGMAYFNGVSWIADTADVGTIAGNRVTISPTLTVDVNFKAGMTCAAVLYSVPVPTPTSSPTVVPTETPTETPTAEPTRGPHPTPAPTKRPRPTPIPSPSFGTYTGGVQLATPTPIPSPSFGTYTGGVQLATPTPIPSPSFGTYTGGVQLTTPTPSPTTTPTATPTATS
jgi:hypothetical protein